MDASDHQAFNWSYFLLARDYMWATLLLLSAQQAYFILVRVGLSAPIMGMRPLVASIGRLLQLIKPLNLFIIFYPFNINLSSLSLTLLTINLQELYRR
ncbi:MAG: hypothetical protein ACI80S_000012 [Pseudohongiellaceae bacterium]|jgi:hypothetical protein